MDSHVMEKHLQSLIKCSIILHLQVVLADGRVVTASPTQHPELYKALRGGDNSFGIVTNFNFRAFEQGKVWGGFAIQPPSTTAENLDRLQIFNAMSGEGVENYATENQAHTFNSNGRSTDPEILRALTGLQAQLSNDMRITNPSDIVREGIRHRLHLPTNDDRVYALTPAFLEQVELYTRSQE
ncbi:MAG: hypothetical protein Q9184_007405 [Pyrenodesmia sp. 2 TL-2023]